MTAHAWALPAPDSRYRGDGAALCLLGQVLFSSLLQALATKAGGGGGRGGGEHG